MAQKKSSKGFNPFMGSFDEATFQELSEIESYDAEGNLNSGVAELDINKVFPNPNQPRKFFDEELLAELAGSIREHGVIQPIIVSPSDAGTFVIVAGERRFRASRLAKLDKIPVIVREFSTSEQQEIALIENIQREDLNPIEEARGIRQLMDSACLTQDEVALKLGKSRPAIANALRLLQLEPEVVTLIEQGRLSAGHARTLASVKDPKVQISYALACADKKMSVRELELMVSAYLNPEKKQTPQKPPMSLELKNLVGDMQRIFATKVKAVGTNDKGRIYIDYYTADDLERIFELMEQLGAESR